MPPFMRSILGACLLTLSGFSFAGPVNINTADAKTLAKELKGVGKAKADLIVAFRKENGPFNSADQLRQIKGIGKNTIDQNREHIRLNDD